MGMKLPLPKNHGFSVDNALLAAQSSCLNTGNALTPSIGVAILYHKTPLLNKSRVGLFFPLCGAMPLLRRKRYSRTRDLNAVKLNVYI
jgi:hypothetical protein